MLRISLESARKNAKMTQKEVAKKLHVSNKTIGHWENGKTKPSFSTLRVLADLYNIPIDNIKQ